MTLKSREKIFLLLGFVAIAVLIFDRIYYTPQSRKISKLREEIKATEFKSNESLVLTNGIQSVEAEISRLEKELRGSEERKLSRDQFEAFLKHLAEESNRLQMKMISLITQQAEKKEPSPSKQKKVNLQLVLQSDFNSLGKYLEGMERLPLTAVIDNLQVERDEKIFPRLTVTLGLAVYLVPS